MATGEGSDLRGSRPARMAEGEDDGRGGWRPCEDAEGEDGVLDPKEWSPGSDSRHPCQASTIIERTSRRYGIREDKQGWRTGKDSAHGEQARRSATGTRERKGQWA